MTHRTPDSLRIQAHEHYRAMNDWNRRMKKLSPEAADEEEQLCKNLLEAVLATPEAQLFDLTGWIKAQGYDKQELGRVFSATPYLSGSLQLLDMEFAHATLGIIPIEEVRAVLEDNAPRLFQGVELTEKNIAIQFRRRPL